MKEFLLLFLFVSTVVVAQKSNFSKFGINDTILVPKGLQVGDTAPLISGISVRGEIINSDSILQNKAIVLLFYRGKWCPVCSRHLRNLSDSLSYILEKEAIAIVVGPETFENAEKMKDKTSARFILLPDSSLKVLSNYDVLFYVTPKYQKRIKTFLRTDIAKNNSQEEAQIPVPATYIIDKGGVVTYRHFDYDYTKRASVKDILEHLE